MATGILASFAEWTYHAFTQLKFKFQISCLTEILNWGLTNIWLNYTYTIMGRWTQYVINVNSCLYWIKAVHQYSKFFLLFSSFPCSSFLGLIPTSFGNHPILMKNSRGMCSNNVELFSSFLLGVSSNRNLWLMGREDNIHSNNQWSNLGFTLCSWGLLLKKKSIL